MHRASDVRSGDDAVADDTMSTSRSALARACRDALSVGGALAVKIEGFAPRGSQQQLSMAIAETVEDRAVLRSHQKVIVAAVGEGEVTSGTFSPTLQRSIGFARVPAKTGDRCEVEIRGKLVPARVVRPPFVRHGKVAIAL